MSCVLAVKTVCGHMQGDVLADGSNPAEVDRWQLRHSAKAELEAATQALARGEDVDMARVAAAERVFLDDLKGFMDRWGRGDYSGSEDGDNEDDESASDDSRDG